MIRFLSPCVTTPSPKKKKKKLFPQIILECYFTKLIFQVDYKRLSEDLSKIVDMRGKFYQICHLTLIFFLEEDTSEVSKLLFTLQRKCRCRKLKMHSAIYHSSGVYTMQEDETVNG